MVDFDVIKRCMDRDQFIISNHARMRMFQRNISTDMIIEMIVGGQVIEKYTNDLPCPSALILGYSKEQPLHVVMGQCADHVRIITVYTPDEEYWIDYKKRRKKR